MESSNSDDEMTSSTVIENGPNNITFSRRKKVLTDKYEKHKVSFSLE